MTDTPHVEQRHREAAADLFLEQNPRPYDAYYAVSLRSGRLDHHTLVQAFARFEATHLATLTAERDAAIREMTKCAREAGEAKGCLEASEWPGVVDGWREKCEALERERDALREALENAREPTAEMLDAGGFATFSNGNRARWAALNKGERAFHFNWAGEIWRAMFDAALRPDAPGKQEGEYNDYSGQR
jgi:hypothetical protein